MIELTEQDELTIIQYILNAHPGYVGPVLFRMSMLVDLHMMNSRRVVKTALIWARHNSKGMKNA